MNEKSIVKTVIWQNIDTVADMTPEDFIKSDGLTREEAIKLMTNGFLYRETDTEIQKFELKICSKDIFADEARICIKDIIKLMVGKETKVTLFSLDDEILFTEEDNYTLDEVADFLSAKYPYDYEPFEFDIKT